MYTLCKLLLISIIHIMLPCSVEFCEKKALRKTTVVLSQPYEWNLVVLLEDGLWIEEIESTFLSLLWQCSQYQCIIIYVGGWQVDDKVCLPISDFRYSLICVVHTYVGLSATFPLLNAGWRNIYAFIGIDFQIITLKDAELFISGHV